ncbi:hypothetical protein K3G39_08190 [Pontibacter sp. HSC-14F20]|uniref:hypothetical protein n=1 Tax=Pontibacter sp. HSC-14F20 TaxID=2864136 RepID=UPI001C73D553|nr:hypothetical protein [Pontibacter sp. HSC-14F20]MBX0333216.1 hypothetical protein [Pontibacter sp. HSC-14F20]
MMMKRQLFRIFFAGLMMLTLSLVSTEAYSQCAMCRATVESNVGTGRADSDSQVGSGLNTGILYLMLIPYVLVGTVGFLWYKSNRQKKAKIA